jgi:gas vesicle protein
MNETPYYRSLPSIVSFLAGGVAGVAVTALFAPPAGNEKRTKIGVKRSEATESALDLKERADLARNRKPQS